MKDKDTRTALIEKRLVYYTTILSQLISNNGRHLIVGCKIGKLALFKLNEILLENLNADTIDDLKNVQRKHVSRSPSHVIPLPSQLYSLAWYSRDSNDHFISGGNGMINAWQLTDDRITSKWTLSLAQNNIMVNCLASHGDGTVLAGCGDNHIYRYDLNTQQMLNDFMGHDDYINALTVDDDDRLFSGSEDGTVRIWDIKSGKLIKKLSPFETESIARRECGKWIGSVATEGRDWLICGGGPVLCLWDLRSLAPSIKFEGGTKDWTSNVVRFHGDYLIGGGNAPYVYIWEMNGVIKSEIPSSAANVFAISALTFDGPNDVGIDQVICAAGTSYKIDVCTNWTHKDFELLVM